jgi:hypothetical protein
MMVGTLDTDTGNAQKTLCYVLGSGEEPLKYSGIVWPLEDIFCWQAACCVSMDGSQQNRHGQSVLGNQRTLYAALHLPGWLGWPMRLTNEVQQVLGLA